MSYNFDAIIDRRKTHAVKWDVGRDVTARSYQMPASGPSRVATKDGSGVFSESLLPMWVADMDFPCPPEIVDAFSSRAVHHVFGYMLAPESFYNAFIEWERARNGWEVDRESVVYTPGVMPAVKAAIDVCTRPGDGVVVQPPVYFPFFHSVELKKRQLVLNPLLRRGNRYEMDLDDLEHHFKEGARALLLCSPHNPVGRVWTREELSALVSLCKQYDVTIISDEIHSDIIMPGKRFTPLLSLGTDAAERTIACLSPSKTFNIAGTSAAYAVIEEPQLRAGFKKASAAAGIDHPSIFPVVASEAAYTEGEAWLDELLPYLWDNFAFLTDFLSRRLPDVRVTPLEGTYITWLDFREVCRRERLSDDDLKQKLKEEAGVWLSNGPQFGTGGEGFQRLNIATPRALLEEGLTRIARVFGTDRQGTGDAGGEKAGRTP